MAGQALKHVLDGYKILDFTQLLAGPSATRMLVEMGAEVLKLELAPGGDPARRLPYLKDGHSGYFIQQNRGKKSICVDVRSPEGKEIVKGLVAKVDVLVENFSPGAIGRLGFGYEAVRTINPAIVMCSLSAFGQSGPLSADPGYDYIGQAYAGVTSMIGDPDGPPSVPALGLGDVNAGVHAALAICAALLYRHQTGKGQHLDITLLDSYFHCLERAVHAYSLSGGTFKPKRSGSHHGMIAPSGVFKGKEGYIVIMAILDHQWRRLCDVIGRPELVTDPRFLTNTLRVANRTVLIDAIEKWFASMPSDDEAIRLLRENRIPVAPVLSIEQAVHHPHLRQRGTVRKIHDRFLGEFDVPGFPLRFSEFPAQLDLEAPLLGEHNRDVLGAYLGYDSERISELEKQGFLRRENP